MLCTWIIVDRVWMFKMAVFIDSTKIPQNSNPESHFWLMRLSEPKILIVVNGVFTLPIAVLSILKAANISNASRILSVYLGVFSVAFILCAMHSFWKIQRISKPPEVSSTMGSVFKRLFESRVNRMKSTIILATVLVAAVIAVSLWKGQRQLSSKNLMVYLTVRYGIEVILSLTVFFTMDYTRYLQRKRLSRINLRINAV
eukprot:c7953_g1_i5.p1 GENE.c7953_g1_i5~~c7953_g1_i5.p1  ORF type:complete len:200 (-),score=29.47 c7953_g1_i5:4-603(-)